MISTMNSSVNSLCHLARTLPRHDQDGTTSTSVWPGKSHLLLILHVRTAILSYLILTIPSFLRTDSAIFSPWAHRSLIMRKLKGLEDYIGKSKFPSLQAPKLPHPPSLHLNHSSEAAAPRPHGWPKPTISFPSIRHTKTEVSSVHPHMGDLGWPFQTDELKFKNSTEDKLFGFKHIREVYFKADPGEFLGSR